MKKIKNVLIIFGFILISSCGYTPLLNQEKINFYISDFIFEGDRQVNNYIENNLKNYKISKDNVKIYKLKISSRYEKILINKDKNGNPKNYNLKIKIDLDIITDSQKSETKSFEGNISLAAQSKKIEEKELEKKYKKDLSKILSEDIIFYLITK